MERQLDCRRKLSQFTRTERQGSTVLESGVASRTAPSSGILPDEIAASFIAIVMSLGLT